MRTTIANPVNLRLLCDLNASRSNRLPCPVGLLLVVAGPGSDVSVCRDLVGEVMVTLFVVSLPIEDVIEALWRDSGNVRVLWPIMTSFPEDARETVTPEITIGDAPGINV